MLPTVFSAIYAFLQIKPLPSQDRPTMPFLSPLEYH